VCWVILDQLACQSGSVSSHYLSQGKCTCFYMEIRCIIYQFVLLISAAPQVWRVGSARAKSEGCGGEEETSLSLKGTNCYPCLVLVELRPLLLLYQHDATHIFCYEKMMCFLNKTLFLIIFFFLFSFRWYWGLTQGFMFAKQALYCLSHATCPLFSGHFWDRVYLFTQAGLGQSPPILDFWSQLRWQTCTTILTYWFDRKSCKLFAQAGLELWFS
jgi:hypothetical protein